MNFSPLKKSVLIAAIAFCGYGTLHAQVTTSSMQGVISQSAGTTVTATHVPSATIYTGVTNETGRFNIPNMRVGGPYRIEVSRPGKEAEVYEDVYLQLGEPFVLDSNVTTTEQETAIEGVTIVSSGRNNLRKTGATTVIGRKQIENMPTLSRSLQDFTRLTPQANGNSFGGANNRYNNITIDGAVNNDVFGLSGSGTPGGQAGTQPISLDAIQEIQVALAPFDVTQGSFTGAGVNAVTRSGTNKYEGSVYFFGRNENTIGKNVFSGEKSGKFTDNQYGFRIGGPLVENKLFFFLNAEAGRRSNPQSFIPGETGVVMTQAIAQQIADHARTAYGYDVGSYGPQDIETQNNKVFAKIDWNINSKHQLALRYNFIDAFDDNIQGNPTFFRFGNNAYQFNNKQNVAVAELRSNFNSNFSNNLIVGYSSIRDSRETAGALFPQVTILNIAGVSGASTEFGSQRSSVANELDQNIFEITDNFKWFVGKHTFTLGTHNEFFRFRNLFINNYNGRWDFNSVEDFINNKPARVRATYSLDPNNDKPAAEFSAAQLAFYAQGESEFFKNFRMTYGLRVDVPIINDTPPRNEKIETSFPGYKTDRTPSGKLLWAPRLGFNYNVNGDRSLVLRGGVGVFTGRVPFVWLSNQFSNNGVTFGTVDARNNAINGGNGFDPNIANQRNMGAGSTRAEVNLVSEDFKIPQVLRYNLAGEFRLPFGINATLEGILSKTLNNIIYSDINLKPSAATINSALSGGADLRPYYGAKVNSADFTNVILMDNTSRGYTYSLTTQLQKSFRFGLDLMAAYTNGQSASLNDGASSTALSNWEFVQIVNNPNSPELTSSIFDIRHRTVGSVGYKVSYGRDKEFGTGINLFYAGNSGSPFTYLYNGDLNGDGAFSNDLLYVPRNMSEIKLVALTGSNPATPAEQWAALDTFISQDPYLSTRRGQYAERNGAKTPWEHRFDLRVSQDLGLKIANTVHKLQLTFDIFNFGNLLNKEWGRSYFVNNNAYQLVTYTTSGGGGFTFRAPSDNKAYSVSDLGSRWQGQFGVRYIF